MDSTILERYKYNPSKALALQILRPSYQWSMDENDVITFWHPDNLLGIPTEQEINDCISEIASLKGMYLLKQKRNEYLKNTDIFMVFGIYIFKKRFKNLKCWINTKSRLLMLS